MIAKLAGPAYQTLGRQKKYLLLLGACCLLIGVPLYWLESTRLVHFNVDWNIAFYPAARLLLEGRNPYEIPYFHNPIWSLIPVLPLALLGQQIGGLLLFFLNFCTYAYVGYRLRARPVALVALLLSPLVFYNQFLGNIDSLVLWGLLMPPWVGLFFVAVKPQIGIGVAIYLAYLAWREGGWRRLLWSIAPVSVALALSFFLFGNWLVNPTENVVSTTWNLSLFPWAVPVGVVLLALSMQRLKLRLALSSSPFLAPYISLGSWSIALMGLLESPRAMVGTVFGLWLFYGLYSYLH